MDDISIDRLVLDIPGLSVAEAKQLSDRIGQGLADASPIAGSFGRLTVDLNDEAVSRNVPRLADMIVDAILRQIG